MDEWNAGLQDRGAVRGHQGSGLRLKKGVAREGAGENEKAG